MAKMKMERLRFSYDDDLNMLREVLRQNPFEDYSRWKEIHINFMNVSGRPFTLRAVKDHLEHLLKLYVKGDYANLRKSSSTDKFEEKQQLLKEIREITVKEYKNNQDRRRFFHGINNEASVKKVKDLNTNSNSSNEAQFDLYSSDNNFVFSSKIEPEVQNEISDDNEFEYSPTLPNFESATTVNDGLTRLADVIQNKSVVKSELRQKELELEERKISLKERRLALDEEKFQLDKYERDRRLEMELREREMHLKLVEQQQQVVTFFLKQSFNHEK